MDVAAKGCHDAQYLSELERWLARFEIDNERDANTAHRRKLRLLQLLRLAFTAHDESKRGAIHITGNIIENQQGAHVRPLSNELREMT